MPQAWRVFSRWLRLRRQLWRWRRAVSQKPVRAEAPLRAQLFNVEQMERHGRALALAHRVHARAGPERLLERLTENEGVLDDACNLLTRMVQDDMRVTPAGEWLLDNYYLVEEQIVTARRHLPKGYSRQLPSLSEGPSAGLPRVYDLSLEAIAHGDGRIDAETLRRFFAAYQSVTPLKLGELWAIPIMLRLALIDNLRRMAVQLMRDGEDHRLASEWAGLLNRTAAEDPKNVVLVVADMARSDPPLSGAFISELTRGLQGRGSVFSMPITWLEQWAAHGGQRIEELVHLESQQQAADQVSISNSIGSLRFLAEMDWREFVEDMSVVEHTLRRDPAGIYAQMDFSTRDNYRHVIEKIARLSGVDERAVAEIALDLARAAAATDPVPYQAHVGFYLIDDGVVRTRQAVAGTSGGRPVRLRLRRIPLPVYLIPIAVIVVAFTRGLLSAGLPLPGVAIGLTILLALLAFSELAIALVNWTATVLVPPHPLPRMDFSEGIPAQARTLVVVPCMLDGEAGVDRLAEALEVRFLANRDRHLHFALLSDFLDADQAGMPGDDALVAHAAHRIEQLNRRYAPERTDSRGGDLFFLFHRKRLWNPRERRWMGYERKRGKLAALNRLLRGGGGEDFVQVVGNTDVLSQVRYVISLDTDTRLPRDAARELAGTLAHPLNLAVFDERRRRVVRGYGILQPSVGTSLSGRPSSRYARMFGSEPGIDPYTRTVSDVYQDLFGEGSFVGKGIYDVDAFEHALAGRLPDDRILSHDLLEGCYARAGLVSDVRLYEDYPARYAADVRRRSRWIRGDWQLLPWLLPWVPRRDGGFERNPLSWLSRGKLLDNLRRSLVPASTLALLVIGWLFSPDPLGWTTWLLSLWALPVLLPALRDLFSLPVDMPLEAHLVQVGRSSLRQLLRAAVDVACLPYEACFSLTAILRTLWRLLVTRRQLLQWHPSSEVERSLGGVRAELLGMAPAPLIAVAIAALLAARQPAALAVAAPLLAAWLLSPALMAWLGRPRGRRGGKLSAFQSAFLGKLSRRTWAFFETYVRAEDHWLPPDNVQEHPALVVARRTSPTNIGLSLLANLAAWDFGYLQVGGVIERTRRVFDTLDALKRHRGHFYNWYDTQTLQPLPPAYVSTVDSGNLAGHLLTLRQGLLALADAPILAPATFTGLADTLAVLEDELAGLPAEGDAPSLALAEFRAALTQAQRAPPATFADADRLLVRLLQHAEGIAAVWPAGAAEPVHPHHWPTALIESCRSARNELEFLLPDADARTDQRIPTLRELLEHAANPLTVRRARERIHQLERLAHIAGQFSLMEYDFLYDRARHLLVIGYNVEEHRLDSGLYDLLASEARLCSFVAIAQGQLPQESWFALGRLLTEVDGNATLLSWSGSMFEYLMPQLVMPSYPDTLLDQTARHAVDAQIAYGERHDVPWGISESGYNAVDARMNYQYRAFGVPGLGLKRGLSQELVVAPYASMMALMVAPEAACQNLQRLTALGFGGQFGLYEAIDYTAARIPPGQTHVVVRSFMAHHQGMGFLSLVHLLRQQPMQRRFEADAEFQATVLLLQERIPHTGVFHPHEAEAQDSRAAPAETETQLRIFRDPNTSRPAVQLLSNGRYHGLLTSAGGGYSRHRDMAVTRWREDGTRDHWGSFCYLRDVESGEFWSTSLQPTCVPVEQYEAIFSDAKAEFRGRKRGYESHLEIAISAEDDIELRRLRLSNRSRHTRTIEITTYAEVVLAPAIADELHPAFSNLFVQSQIVREKQALLCTRRPRESDAPAPWMFHLVAVHDADIGAISYETDRARFLGRGNTPRRPSALVEQDALSDSEGSVLDPIVAIRCRIGLAPGQTASIDMVYGVGADREACIGLVDKYRDRRLADRVFDLAWTQSQVVRRQINASQADAQLYERLAGLIVYAHPLLRADARILLQNQRGQSGLWGHAISGDLPMVLLQIADAEHIELARQMVQAHAYWRLKGLRADLVIWNESQSGYRQQLQDLILGMVSADPEANVLDRPGGIFVRPGHQISQEDRILLQSAARVIIHDQHGSLAAQIGRREPAGWTLPPLLAAAAAGEDRVEPVDLTASAGLPVSLNLAEDSAAWPFDTTSGACLHANGIGAFAVDAGEYVIDLREGSSTPAPWSNVLANEELGTVVSESMAGYTWFENAHEFRLTPWHNDPIADSGGEAFYLRDEDTGYVWSPLPLPRRGRGAYRTRHGFGYSVYEHVEDGIASELWVYVAVEDAVKYSVLKLRNRSGRARRLSATGYVEWVLGDLRVKSQMHVVTAQDADSGVLTARNPYNTEFNGRVAFFDTDASGCSFTGDRTEFLGRNGSLGDPAALRRERLSGRLGVGLDPCAAIQVPLSLADGASAETVFRLGVGKDHGAALQLARRVQGAQNAHDALDAVRRHWRDLLTSVQVRTPDADVDALVNGWLPYQTLACRYVARTGYYQSGGAFGFRDQLQDTMATLHARPALTRAHLLLCAAHQFPQGDVLHWWHPPQGRGVRTRCSDDYLWLPLAAARYLEVTGDVSVLDEEVGFVDGRPVSADEESYYDMPATSCLRQSFYEHCVLALRRGCRLLGEHGLPLIGTGDWNDGMNRVGEAGRGESVWLGFFLYDTLQRFIAVARRYGDAAFAEACAAQAQRLRVNLEAHAWDGQWYRRAWFDDGTPLGSSQSEECRIDSISQSWSVLSGAADPARARQAMAAMDRHLVKREAGIIQLLDPPFDRTSNDPGYIRGYVPGVRENGGQYTHAAVWAAMAFAQQGDAERAWELARMINPIRHTQDADAVAVYKVEPYVLAADVYGVAPHVGRGGWTWYTGSAGWMYRLLTESLLGLQRRGEELLLAPCLPRDWPEYELRYRFGTSVYVIRVQQIDGGAATLQLDGVEQPGFGFALLDDAGVHEVQARWPRAPR
ncbi:MAG: cyclic beta 1-2 glucan synthetase [Rhodanobacter denitrificans]|uniref:Cyclic beta 1-2 glucan synthetase n=1 Tax=Rhodanobacter denitrificans TaxID=666685 RepID=A0A2W5K5K1_9GAMM|nr:MAG: cyclic beta 1-2 glucan synthetase [Rhodanobacter denitrificans]